MENQNGKKQSNENLSRTTPEHLKNKPGKIENIEIKPTGPIVNLTDQVSAGLQAYPVTLKALYRALKSRGFFILISWYEVADPENHPDQDLQHHYENNNFNKDDILPSIQHQKLHYIKTFRPDIDVATIVCPHCGKEMPDQRGFI